jgi:hypothetical protein
LSPEYARHWHLANFGQGFIDELIGVQDDAVTKPQGLDEVMGRVRQVVLDGQGDQLVEIVQLQTVVTDDPAALKGGRLFGGDLNCSIAVDQTFTPRSCNRGG